MRRNLAVFHGRLVNQGAVVVQPGDLIGELVPRLYRAQGAGPGIRSILLAIQCSLLLMRFFWTKK